MSQRETTKSKLPPLDLQEEVDRFKAFQEKKDIRFSKCDHMSPKSRVVNGEVRCQCGAGWMGSNIAQLAKLLGIK